MVRSVGTFIIYCFTSSSFPTPSQQHLFFQESFKYSLVPIQSLCKLSLEPLQASMLVQNNWSLCRLLLFFYKINVFSSYQLLHIDLVVARPHLMWCHSLFQAFQLCFHFFLQLLQLFHISIIDWSFSFFRIDQNPLFKSFLLFLEALLQAFQFCVASFQLCSWVFVFFQPECLCQAFQLAKCLVALIFQILALLQVLSIRLFQAFLGSSSGTATGTAKQHPLWGASDLQVGFHPFKVLVIQSLPTHFLGSLCQTLYYKVLLQYYPVLQNATPVLLCTTKYYSSITLYYKVLLQYYSSTTLYYTVLFQYYKVLLQYYSVLLQYYSVLHSTTPVLLCTTKCYSSTTLYYKVLLQYYSVLHSTTPALLCTTKY